MKPLLGSHHLAAEDPLLVGVHVDGSATARAIVHQTDDALQSVAVGLYPTWLPEAGAVDGTARLEQVAATTLADRLARRSPDYGPYLRALTTSAVTGRPLDDTVALELRIGGVLRVIARSYARSALVVLVPSGDPVPRFAPALADAAEWIAAHGDIAVWIDVTTTDGLGRYLLVDLTARPEGAVVPGVAPTADPSQRVDIPPVEGMPAPNSPAEQALERHLSSQPWAVGRRWNTLVATSSTLDVPMRVDLVWRDVGVVVEIDGPDHRTPEKYAADRRRDNTLQRIGHLVLRYTNEQVLHDVAQVAGELEQTLAARGTLVRFPPRASTPVPRG